MEFKSLNKKSEFIELKKFGKRINHRFVSITYVEKQKEDFKLGFQISKKSGSMPSWLSYDTQTNTITGKIIPTSNKKIILFSPQ